MKSTCPTNRTSQALNLHWAPNTQRYTRRSRGPPVKRARQILSLGESPRRCTIHPVLTHVVEPALLTLGKTVQVSQAGPYTGVSRRRGVCLASSTSWARYPTPPPNMYREQPAKQAAPQAVVMGAAPIRYANMDAWTSGEVPTLSRSRDEFDPRSVYHPPLTELAYVLRSDRRFSGFKSQVADQFCGRSRSR